MSAEDFLEGWPRHVIRLAATGSTNTDAKLRLAEGLPPDFVIVAERQTAGRGRNGKHWQSPVGNLYLSAALAPWTAAARAGELAFVAANSAADVIAELTGSPDVTVKWPNDILIADRKVAGILIENSIEHDKVRHSIIGIGVNVRHAPSIAAYPADCIANHDAGIGVDAVLDGILAALKNDFQQWNAQGFGPIRDRWIARAWRMGQPIVIESAQGLVTGVMNGIDDHGALLIQHEQRITKITSGSLAYGRSNQDRILSSGFIG